MPNDNLDGVAVYERWEDVPEGLAMKAALAEQGLRPPTGATPAAVVSRKGFTYQLWVVAEAVAIKKRGVKVGLVA